ncbi:MAG: Ig-like domain-containing protein [Candidatus Accumulibacter necessarius]|jgi:RHS repeat-associated protein|uniref:Ig-like domain-containing protein n=1 Tax=Candidatus Accumulibacter necessarius TaxID=2954386 RepID=UPI002FC2FCA3
MKPNDCLTPASSLRRWFARLIGGLCSLCLVLLAGQAWATPCDLDQDGDVDLDDVTQLQRSLPGRPKVSGPDDPRDPDRNGRIDILDARVCVLRCTLPRCARVSPTPPTVSLTAPVADARYLAPATITLAADASGATPVTRVEFLADATVIATVGNSPYTVDWPNVAAGTYQLSARATDRAGAATTSGARRIIVDSHNTPPTVSLTAPLDGAAYPLSATVTLMATASDVEVNTPISRVDFYHGQTLIGGSTTAPYRLDWTPPAAGVYRLTARATDSAGATTISAAHDLTVQGNLPPTVSLTSPGANQSFMAPATVTLTADANDPDGVARVDFFHGATLIGSAVSSPYRVAWNHVPAGRYLLTAQATDRLGASQTSAAVPITVNAPASAGLTILYLHADHLGTPRVATDESQTVVWRNPPTTEPFGMALPEEDPDGDGRVTTINLRFPGQYFDQETQAHYNYFRDHYFPELGRYGQSDPIGLAGGINTYGYAKGKPLSYSDPLGLWVYGVYNNATGQININDLETGQSISGPFVSGGRPFGDAIPNGIYDILQHPDSDFYRLEPVDDSYGDDTSDRTARNNFRLHRPGRTIGCIAAEDVDNWTQVRDLIRQTQTDHVTVQSKSRRPWSPSTEQLRRYGRIVVINSN